MRSVRLRSRLAAAIDVDPSPLSDDGSPNASVALEWHRYELRPLIAIRISVLQYASREFLLERYSAHAVPAEYLRAGPLLNLVSTGSGTLPEALNTSTPVLYLLIHICIGSAYCHAAAAANLRASVLLNFVRNTLKGLLVGLPEWLARKPSCPRAYI